MFLERSSAEGFEDGGGREMRGREKKTKGQKKKRREAKEKEKRKWEDPISSTGDRAISYEHILLPLIGGCAGKHNKRRTAAKDERTLRGH